MSASETFPFSVEVKSAPHGFTSTDAEITVLDGHDEVRARGRGKLQLDLPAGLYAIQVDRAGTRQEEVRRHSGPTTVELGEPKRYSAVPADDTATSHEYYQWPAVEWSTKTTAPALPAAPAPMGSLFIFVRAPSSEAVTPPLEAIGLRILDYSRQELAVLDDATTERDRDAGWLAFNADAPAGAYVLRYDPPHEGAAPAREMAIGVSGGWQTQIFITHAYGPSFASASVLMGHGFRPDDRISQAVDAALTGLQNGTDLLLAEERQLLLYGKFDNPMLGLVGAHALFRATAVEQAVIETIVGNLGWLLGPDAPDLHALRLMAARRFGTPVDVPPFERPPTLRAGLEAVLEAAVERPELIPPGGLLAEIAPRRFVDSPWSTWKPVLDTQWLDAHEAFTVAPAPDWVSQYVRDAALQAARQDQELDVATIAARASLPLASVADAYEEVRRTIGSGPRRTIEMERLVTRSRREAKQLELDPGETRRLFFEGSEGDRVRVLGLMQGDASIQDFDVALAGVRGSKSAFEQYHALKLGQQMIPKLDEHQRQELASAVSEQRGPGAHIAPGTDRWYLSRQLLSDLDVGA